MRSIIDVCDLTGLQVVDLMLKIMKNHKTSIHENREKIQRKKIKFISRSYPCPFAVWMPFANPF